MSRLISLAMLVICLFAAVSLAAGKVTLKDGRTFEGPLFMSDQKVGVATEEGLRLFDRDEIASIEEDPASKATPEQRRLYRETTQKVTQARTPEEALKILLEYVESRPEEDPMKAVARRELDTWSTAAREGKVVWGGKLMSPEERDAMKVEALRKLSAAATFNDAGRTGEALPLLRDAIRKWPEQPGIQFHLALALQRDRKPNDAAKYYRMILSEHPDHVPSLNNLAALECTRRQFLSGVPLMLRALELGGDVVLINDNGHRTLLRMEQQGVRGFEEDRAKLQNAVTRLEAAMRDRGLSRWGTSWVTRDRYEQYVAANRQIEAQLEALAADIAGLEAQTALLKARIAELERQRWTAPKREDLIREAEVDPATGRIIRPRVVYPPGTLTREDIELQIADGLARLAVTEETMTERLIAGQKLKASRVDPPMVLDYLLLTAAGDELMLERQKEPVEVPTPEVPAPAPVVPSPAPNE